jgi:hypothetical protein
MLDLKTKQDIKAVLDYLWHEEAIHYQCGPSPKHIFIVLKRLAKTIEYYKD